MRWSFVLPVLALLFGAGHARADNEAEAKAAYTKGRTFFKEGRYAEAVTELKKAYALKPHPALLRYMGDTYYKMNKARLAIQEYKRYLAEAPEAPDRDKIEAKVKQLELIVGAGEEETPRSTAPGPSAAPAPLPPPLPARSPRVIDAPTGEDREVPLALRRRALMDAQQQQTAPTRHTSGLAIAKWTTLAIGVAGLVVGGVFTGLASSKANQINSAITTGCPASTPDCGGNPDKSQPVRPFSKDDYDLLQSNKLYRQVSLASFIVGGAFAGASVVMFILDRGSSERPAPTTPRASFTPVFGNSTYGVSGQVSF